MAGFTAGWLALREPADAAARSQGIVERIGQVLPRDRIRAVDLGTGTGANVRYLAGRLPARQEWLLVDDDPRLLEEAASAGPSCAVRRADLAAEMMPADATDIFEGRDLVTGSALLDLVSAKWLRQLALHCHRAAAAVLFPLVYDGTMHCWPQEPGDDLIRELVNAHQRRDKGFGPALGPAAAGTAVRCFAALGYHVEQEATPWILTPTEQSGDRDGGERLYDLQRQLIEGWAQAAEEALSERTTWVAQWRSKRLEHVTAKRSRITVGHLDVGAWLPGVLR
jgi:hypothetical protein